MKQKIRTFVSRLALVMAMVVFVLPPLSFGSCKTEEIIIHNEYLGSCGYTQNSSFTLEQDTYITSIRIWYDSYISGDTLSATLSGPDGYTNSSGEIYKDGCYGNWCAAMFNINKVLKAGTYTLTADSKSVCSNPSGATTLILYGCDTEEQLPDDSAEDVNPPSGISTVDANANPNNAPVYMGNIVSSGGVSTLSGKMELSVDFPAYNRPVDIWIVIVLPDGRWYMADEYGQVLPLDQGIFSIATSVSGIKTEKAILTPFEVGAPGTAFAPWPKDGVWTVYWLVAPEINGDIFKAIENCDYQLGFYMFEVNSNNNEDNQQTQEIGVSGGAISLSGISLTIPQDAFSDLRTIAIQKTSLLSEQEDLSDTYTITGLPYTINGEIVLDIESKTELDSNLSDQYYVSFQFEENTEAGFNYITYGNYLLKGELVGNNKLRVTIPAIDFAAIINTSQDRKKTNTLRINDEGLGFEHVNINAVQLTTLSTSHFTTSIKKTDETFANKTLNYLEEIYQKLGDPVDKGGLGFDWTLDNCRINTNTFQYEKIPVVFSDLGKDGDLGGYNPGLLGSPCNIILNLSSVLEFNTNTQAITDDAKRKSTVAHELFHFLQEIYNRETLTETWAEASSMWIETIFGNCPSENKNNRFAWNGFFNVCGTAVQPQTGSWDEYFSPYKIKRRWHGYESSNFITYGVSNNIFDIEKFWRTLHNGNGEIEAFKSAIQKKNSSLTLGKFWKDFALELTTKRQVSAQCLPLYTTSRWNSDINNETSFPVSYSFDAFSMSFSNANLNLKMFTTSKTNMNITISAAGLIDGQEVHIHDFNSGAIELGVITNQSNKLTIVDFENYQKAQGAIAIVFIDSNIPSGVNPSQAAIQSTNSVVINIETEIDENVDAECNGEAVDYSKLEKMDRDNGLYYTKDNCVYGLQTVWYDNERTRLYYKLFWCNCMFNGPATVWYYETGNKMKEGNFKDNKETGLWTHWYSDGTKSKEGSYVNGKEEGLWTYWHPNGVKESEGNYTNGERKGVWTFWYHDGSFLMTITI